MITLHDIESQRTAKGGFTRDGLAKLGVPWPPKRGWLKRLIREAAAGESPPDGIEHLEYLISPERPAAKRTVRVIFDGGTSCNIPRLGYGDGYGSYQIDGGLVHRCFFGIPMSANAAEVRTAAYAVQAVSVDDEATTDIHFFGDSRIALKWCRLAKSGSKSTPGGSAEFANSIRLLFEALKPFRAVRADWWQRENSVRVFGH